MEKLLQQLIMVNKSISEQEKHLKEIDGLPYYKLFGTAKELKSDKEAAVKRLEKTIEKKKLLLCQIEDEVTKEREKLNSHVSAA